MTALKKIGIIAGAVYLFLLLLSWATQTLFPAETQFNRFEKSDQLVYNEEELDIHYFNIEASSRRTMMILIPDAYQPAEELIPLAETLADSMGVIIPVLNKGGLRNYISNQERGEILSKWINQLPNRNIHIGGFRYGGLVAIETITKNENDLKSLTLIQSMGIEEIHFLGNYRINRSVYSLMVPVFTIFRYGFPHFGWAETMQFNRHFISTMLAMDQRHIENLLREITVPVRIIHSTADPQIPVQTALEIYRLIPHSTLDLLAAKPDQIRSNPDDWSTLVQSFIRQVDNQNGMNRALASSERIAESMETFSRDDIAELSGQALLLLILFLIIISLVSEDSACIAAGLLFATGLIGFQHALIGGVTGIISADLLIYASGRYLGYPVLQIAPFKWFIRKQDIMRARDLFQARGAEILIATRFVPGTRLPVYLAAGILKTDFWPFLAYFLASLAVWAPLLIWVTSLIGQPMLTYIELYQEYALLVILAASILLYGFIKYILPLGTVKGRRQAFEKWRRIKEKRDRSNTE
ncbi:VTT domain-containing protein [Rhodohalobacter mucosus]|uniref:VTT domain-containing protein n=1 Tax=Rhodohalobacter mucosus TaxID=2079485 RepID=A0A316TXY9_9BACT|nr:VTT domain-containing protein [Rhodohalobacter mucosus]PWN07602.1 hypothetical protein DDZ15_04925 [Rhodohalobacter mucosus]